jgi:hypothetical protein
MAEVLAEFPDILTDSDAVRYRARAYGAGMPDGTWQGWLEFVPLEGGAPIRSGRETTQPNLTDTAYWATGLTTVYLEGALQRALDLAHAPDTASPVQTSSPATAVLDPFKVYERGEVPLRRQLAALSPWHLVNIIDFYRLSDESRLELARLPEAVLIERIAVAVARSAR